mmetsp:Transcript_15009/g.22903  ORF Transcript_15009/g.22903 Transcript_15009/m.22903 type:complete len:546 (-) Transcript_15009:1216-2853(-)
MSLPAVSCSSLLNENNLEQISIFDFGGVENNFIIKLRLIGELGSPQIRRVRLSRIQVDGFISYAALIDVAFGYMFPDAVASALTDYDINLTYYDIDNDCVTIGSTEELIDAIEQFSTSQTSAMCLRINTTVNKKKIQSFSHTTSQAGDTLTKQRCAKVEVKPVIRKQRSPSIVKSFASILTNVVDNLQTQTTEPRTSVEKNEADLTPQNKGSEIGLSCIRNQSLKTRAKHGDGLDLEKENTVEILFIHGRHTCDGCLYSPIIGPRYHATNMPDYDLCSKCWKKYDGEIKFEVIELERDRRCQERWHRKRAELSANGGSYRRRMSSRPQNQSRISSDGSHILQKQPNDFNSKYENEVTEEEEELSSISQKNFDRAKGPKPIEERDNNGEESDCNAQNGDERSKIVSDRDEIGKMSAGANLNGSSEDDMGINNELINNGSYSQYRSTIESPNNLLNNLGAGKSSGVPNNIIEDTRDRPAQGAIDGHADSDADRNASNASIGKTRKLLHQSEDEWDVLVTEKLESDDTIGRAAEVIGSALFDSELRFS